MSRRGVRSVLCKLMPFRAGRISGIEWASQSRASLAGKRCSRIVTQESQPRDSAVRRSWSAGAVGWPRAVLSRGLLGNGPRCHLLAHGVRRRVGLRLAVSARGCAHRSQVDGASQTIGRTARRDFPLRISETRASRTHRLPLRSSGAAHRSRCRNSLGHAVASRSSPRPDENSRQNAEIRTRGAPAA